MDKNLEDMEKLFEEMDLNFLEGDLLDDDDEEIQKILKELLDDIDNLENDSEE
jgi:hypothetical protein